MNNWVKISKEEMEISMSIANLKKGELQIKYVKDIVAKGKEIEELKAKLEMYENGVYFSSENDELQERIDKAIEYLGINEEILETCEIYDVNGIEVYKILQGNNWNEVERAYLDDKPIGSDKE